MINCQNKVSADQYHMKILKAWVKVLGFQLDCGLKPGSPGQRDGVNAKAKFWSKLNHDTLLTFPLTYSLHNRLLQSP